MIEHRRFDRLPAEELNCLKARRHFSCAAGGKMAVRDLGCIRAWNDEEIGPNGGFAMQSHANVEIVTYVREGTITHRDNLGNEGRVEAGNIQIVSAGAGIRHAVYNLEALPARIFQIWLEPDADGGPPAWGTQPCPVPVRSGCFVAIASGIESDQEALPIRSRARVLRVKLQVGKSAEYSFRAPSLAYLVPSSGVVEVNGLRVGARDGAAIRGASSVTITAVEDADILMVDVLYGGSQKRFWRNT